VNRSVPTTDAARLDRVAEIVEAPARAGRFARWLNPPELPAGRSEGQRPIKPRHGGPPMPVDHTAIRLPKALLARVDEVALRTGDEGATGRARNRSLTLRSAIGHGLAELRDVGLRAPVPVLTGEGPASVVGVRLADAVLTLADELIPTLSALPAFATCSTANRSGVLRVAIVLGLDELERRHGAVVALLRPHVAFVSVVGGVVVQVADDATRLRGEVVELRAPSAAALAAIVARVR
jgi:predicted DNA-binding protein